ncbi:MAG: TonB-dependent receptor [Chitinophagaceae bacterium]
MLLKRLLRWAALPLLLLCGQLYAQERVVTGKVSDSSGAPIVSATVSVKGVNRVTLTDASGNFRLTVPANVTTLTISSVGFSPQEVSITGNAVQVVLQRDNQALNEVVVIGYGSVRKKDLTGSVTTITARDFQSGVINTPEQLISGKVPGLAITSNGGQPGAGSTIRIRGGSSLSASNDPLIVVDGVPLDNGSISGATNQLSFINPNDIESFTVLKDASAAAIYGTRASNGVILITTKKGRGGALRVNFNSVNSVSSIVKKVDVLSADEFRSIVNARGTAAQKAMLGSFNTDWQDQIYQTAFGSDNNISISGGLKSLPYRLSLGYLNQEGVLRTDKLQRTSVGLVLNPTFFNNHLKVDINLKGTAQQTRFGNTGAIGGAVSFNPTQPVTVKSDRFGGYFEYLDAAAATGLVNLVGRNPVGLLEQRIDKSNPRRAIGNIQFDYKFHFLPELRANLNLGYDLSEGKGTVYVSDSAADGYIAGGTGGQNNPYRQKKRNTVFEFYLNYAKGLDKIQSRFDVTAGYAYNNYLTTNYSFASFNAQGVKFPNSDPAFPFNKPEHTLLSYFGRANYTFKDRYLLTATVRRDASSRFAPNNRWGLFPSIALAWQMKEESFLKNNSVISDLKLRLSYGVTGQQDGIGNYDYLAYYALSATGASYQFGDVFLQGFRPGGFYSNRKWEETSTANLGLDFGLLDNRISGSIDVYHKKTSDLLNNVPQPAGTNFSAFIVANVGDMENKGVEFNISAQPVRKQNFSWDVNFNITYNKNTITNLTVVPKDINYPGFPSGSIAGGIGGQFVFINAVDFSKSTFNLYKQVYDSAGRPVEGVFVDLNEDGIINQNDLYKGKTANPTVFMGFSSSVRYKKLNASFVLRANVGNYVYNNNYSQTGTYNQILGNAVLYNASRSVLETGFMGNSQQLLSDYYIQNGSFLRMDNLNIGYNVGKIYRRAANLRLSFIVQNVFTITKYKGLDPEVGSGIDNNIYPRPRTFSLGINIDY